MIAAALILHPLILLLIAVLIGLVIIYCVGLFIPDPKLLTVIRLIIGLIILIYALSLFGIVA